MNQSQDKKPPDQQKMPNMMVALIVIFIITFVLNMAMNFFTFDDQAEIGYDQFLRLVDAGAVDQVVMDDNLIQISLKEDVRAEVLYGVLEVDDENASEQLASRLRNATYTTGRMEDPQLAQKLYQVGVRYAKQIEKQTPFIATVLSWVFPVLIMLLLYNLVMRAMMKRMGGSGGLGGMMSVGKSKAKEYTVEKSVAVRFSDVAGQDEAKESLVEMLDYLHNPEKYQSIGAKQPKGALLVGPPGTGKTLLAKALAGEAKVPFYSLSGSEFVEMFVGVGASRVRDLFEQAKKNAPCIIFIDEIDAIGKSRDNQLGSNDEREQTLNQLLSEMDGFDSSKGIIVLAATNRPEVLDKALLRPGRFDRRIVVERPDLIGREAILKVHADRVRLAPDVNLRDIALSTSGAAGADLANMINEGALRAVRMGRSEVSQQDLQEAVEVVIAGKEKKDRILSPKEKRMVAYHEVGHALVSALQKNAQPVQKITIVPRTMGSLGYTMNMPEEERYLLTRSELLAQIAALLGGRAAEQLVFGEYTTGASNDIDRATQLARGMVTQYGMSERFGPMGLESTQNKYLDGRNVSNCSEQTGAAIDEEVRALLAQCQQTALELLSQNRERLTVISEHLIQTENITGEKFMQLLEETGGTAGASGGSRG